MHEKVWGNPEWLADQKERFEATVQTPEYRKKMEEYLHSERNPFRDPATREKSILANRAKGYAHLNGGNGRGATIPELLLSAALGWPLHVQVGLKDGEQPTRYELDLANETLRLGVEVDGKSHLTQKVQVSDRRKEERLTRQGWTILRFTNEQVLKDLPLVLEEIVRRSTT